MGKLRAILPSKPGLKALAVGLIAVASIGVAGPAIANSGDYSVNGARIWRGLGTGGPLGLGYIGQGADVYCWNGEWNYHRNRTTGVTGYSHDSVIWWDGGIPHC
ncbi:hypothetical protein [Phytomonospora endophytica]|uniref:Uncharacterized protein n=1 Tax=Phytomonospora endophytica TaxID=714109 RepID=A0A841FRF9_9ACTN|nr:hypothetical protein [Phytomonospora endophytica]MBB6037403.1 hypothetical protein [Phytomonospora endophytica]GIG69855.1 hypothetical protein Pen01_61500 [Phytomonospora endophytica]